MMNLKRLYFLFLASWLISSCSVKENTLSNQDINKLLSEVDTMSTANYNYHVLLNEREGYFQLDIWINNRKGGTMYHEKGMNICDFYEFNGRKVYRYEHKDCSCEVSKEFMRGDRLSEYAYLSESPFHVENGFHKILLIKKEGSKLNIEEFRIIETDSLTDVW